MQSSVSIGEKAPEFKLKAYFPKDDKIVELEIPKNDGKWKILTFYPGDFTFVCATDIEAFMELKVQFENNGAEIYAISTDSVFSHKGWAQTSPRVSKSTIPMIDDYKKVITSAYGFLNEESGAARRGIAIIDPEGKLQYFSVFNDALGKDAEHIYTAFMALKKIAETKPEDGHICAIPANWRIGKDSLSIDTVKDIGKL
jgi:Peroxiredoxin